MQIRIWITSGCAINICIVFLPIQISLSSFESLVYKDYVLIVPRSKLFRAKQLVLKTLQGNYSEQYSKIGSYVEEIRNTNPGSSVLCKLDGGLFQRMYVSFKVCEVGLAHCRPFISIDGCHLKGKFGGQLLSVVGVDANDCIFPIAYAAVEIENTDTLKWFINLLSEDVNIENQHSWTLMSNRQKFIVDLDEKSRSWRKWDLSSIRCAHAISTIWFNKEHPEAYVDACYTVDTQNIIYEEAINPIRGKTSWPASTFIPKPPIQQPKQPVRPKMKRKKEPDELTSQREQFAKLRKIGVSMTCSKCGQQGHNKRSCKVIS
ncbi:hypothetical protein V6N13_009155 [Hibiscus sabdariffa]